MLRNVGMYENVFAGRGRRGGVGGGVTRLWKKNKLGIKILRFQTNIWYVNSKNWDMICFQENPGKW